MFNFQYNNIGSTLTLLVVLILSEFFNVSRVIGAEVAFLLDNPEVFEKCDGHPGNGIHDLFDMSNVKIEIDDYNMHTEGFVTMIWDVEETDRLVFRVEVFKFQRGTWQPTVYNIIRENFCDTAFYEHEIWHDAVMGTLKEDERICFNKKGAIYHFNVDNYMVFQTTNNNELEGQHKMILTLEAFDKNGKKRPKTLCTQLKGEFTKI
ncbi:uncharacterized protein [Musca autumnalis]|uniref:uncharacterized protein n=1 Tax=Musca autumnalis TaxID=221902 RepID=UPI003CF6C159